MFLLLVGAAGADAPWQESLYLADGGYWPERVAVAITNASAGPISGDPLSLSLPGLAGASMRSLRVCRADGLELLYDVRDARGLAKREGEVQADDRLIVPVECAGHAATTVYVYAGNPQAWAVPDFLPSKSANRAVRPGESGLGVSVGQVERLQLKSARSLSSKRRRHWRKWAEMRVRNFSRQPAENALVRVNLRKARVRLPGISPDVRVHVASGEVSELPCYNLGSGIDFLFGANLPRLSEQLFQVGFGQGPRLDPSAALQDYDRLLAGSANLVANASFENGNGRPDGWLRPDSGGSHQVAAGFSSDARFGKRSLELTVRENAKADWVGWHSGEIPVKPRAAYFLSGWLKGVELQG